MTDAGPRPHPAEHGAAAGRLELPYLRCTACHEAAHALAWRCPACGGVLDLDGGLTARPLDPDLLPRDAAGVRRPDGVWRYRNWLPADAPLSLGEPTTPLIPLIWAGRKIHLKLEGALPTGSFKDRGSALLVRWLATHDAPLAVIDSSGNAGASLAAYCAQVGLPCHVFAPHSASPSKLSQIAAYGAHLHRVPGSRDEVTDAATAWAAQGVYASHAWSPLFLAGIQTFAYELWEQFGSAAPHALVLPVGAGTLLLGAMRGFQALADAGLITQVPRIYGVQSDRCAPLALAWSRGSKTPADVLPGDTVAEGIRTNRPPRGEQILEAVRRSRGSVIAVSDEALLSSRRELAATGVYVEITSAVALAGARQLALSGELRDDETLVAAVSATGLKTPMEIDSAQE